MKYYAIKKSGNIRVDQRYSAVFIEETLRRYKEEKTGISLTSPIIFTEKKDGVMPGYDIRTDRWDIAHEAMAKVELAKVVKLEKSKSDAKAKADAAATAAVSVNSDGGAV